MTPPGRMAAAISATRSPTRAIVSTDVIRSGLRDASSVGDRLGRCLRTLMLEVTSVDVGKEVNSW